MKSEMQEPESQKQGRISLGLEQQIKSLLNVIGLALVFVVLILTNVSRDELLFSDQASCEGARENKCNRSNPWRWGRIDSFGPVYSYRLLSAAVLSIQFLLFALFLALCLHLSLCFAKNREGPVDLGSLYYLIHDVATFCCHGCVYTGLIYFLFAVEALVHIKFPSYQPSTFWNGQSISEEYHNPPYARFLDIFAWFTLSFAVATFLIFATVGKIPILMMSHSNKKKSKYAEPDAEGV